VVSIVSQLEPIAVFTHDFSSASPLRSWPPVPAEHLHGGEILALKTFGSLVEGIRSPAHFFYAAWRDPDRLGFKTVERDSSPTGILFVGNFGVAPYATPRSLVETAEMLNRLDRAQLILHLIRDDDGSFSLSRLEVSVDDPSSPKPRHFRSCWRGAEIKSLDLSLQFDAAPTCVAPFRFHLQGRLPRRYNQGAPIEPEHVQFTASGGAMPLPPWVNY
jgi:hypothetical protein